ncbi:PREDICTED: DALR anticodon-binding domain-containing protein 3 [Dufourea novaeangliae]|uniref:DALR anticodon-binding domain-containing protein 3 n=1 Tax=Dufourea novaeangliae TaxID=178035 RepID=UPI000767DB66|nr:PREDICTED: DALR anticodon-binding domain-containing protein 3 [Dufourea novaeangliae]
MESQMKNLSICIDKLINSITLYLSGNNCTNTSVIKISNDNLSTNGDLYFLSSLKVWKSRLQGENMCDGKCTTILQHFLHMHGNQVDDKTDKDIAKEVLQLLISCSNDWPIKIERYFLEKERVCLFLQRVPIIQTTIQNVIAHKTNYGRSLSVNKVFSLRTHEDKESELTTARLHLIQSVTEKILDLHGCRTCEEDSSVKIVFTSKSQGNVVDNYEKCICGVVKNLKSNIKETSLTWQEYIRNKVNELKVLNDQKYFEMHKNDVRTNDNFLENVAKATATFELLSVKPSRAVFIGCNAMTDKSTTNTKGASFILYNAARIAAIIEKYTDKRSIGEYPNLPDISDVNFSLLNQEEEWDLIYNFIIGYQEIVKDCIKYEPTFQVNPQIICIFLSRLSQKFSVYYRRIRILTEAYDHLIPTMIARLYMLHALQIVLQNALTLMDIIPVSRM